MAVVRVYTTVAAKLNKLPVSDGNLVFVSDTRHLYLDYNGLRIKYNCIQEFPTDKDRVDKLAPVEGYYYVEETGVMWRYKDGWKQLTPSNLQTITFGTSIEDFPKEGKETMIYIADKAIYKWNATLHTYICVANNTEWTTI